MLFTALPLRDVTLKNRAGVSPMCQYSSTDGFANDWHLVHLGGLSVGGAGLVFTEAAAVTPAGRISPQDLGIWDDAHVEFLRRITDFIHGQGAAAGIQLAHAGRKASTFRPWDGSGVAPVEHGGWTDVVGPSALPFADSYPRPHALDEAGIQAVIAAFRAAAVRALAAGFRVIELHAAHGYLLHEFLSPLANTRSDAWGGPLENRARLILAVVDALRQVWPERLPLFVRISCTDWAPGGWDIDEAVVLAGWLKLRGADVIDCSSGGMVPHAVIPAAPGYQVPFAGRVKREAGVATAAVGLITDAEQAERIVADGHADVVLLARELLRQPHWPLLAASRLGADVEWPAQHRRAKP